MKNIIIFSLMILVLGLGCTTQRSQFANDGYVPWWVEDGVPNSDGVIITR